MRLLAALVSGLTLALTLFAPARAEPFDVFGRSLEFPVVPGYCTLQDSVPIDKLLIDNILATNQGVNHLVAYFARCEDLNDLRAGRAQSIPYAGTIMVPLVNGSFIPLPGSRAAMLDGMAAEIPKVDPAMLQEIEGNVNDKSLVGTLADMQFLGIVERDQNALYLGLLAMVISDDGTRTPMATIMAMTLLQDVVLTVNLTRPYESNEDIAALLAELRPYVAALIAANP